MQSSKVLFLIYKLLKFEIFKLKKIKFCFLKLACLLLKLIFADNSPLNRITRPTLAPSLTTLSPSAVKTATGKEEQEQELD